MEGEPIPGRSSSLLWEMASGGLAGAQLCGCFPAPGPTLTSRDSCLHVSRHWSGPTCACQQLGRWGSCCADADSKRRKQASVLGYQATASGGPWAIVGCVLRAFILGQPLMDISFIDVIIPIWQVRKLRFRRVKARVRDYRPGRAGTQTLDCVFSTPGKVSPHTEALIPQVATSCPSWL